jgi:selenocysteine lyase/cysteine desulfurase
MPEVGSASWTARDVYTHKDGARRFETWEASHALQLGLGRAIEYALELGLDSIWERVSALAEQLRENLNALSGVRTYDTGQTKCGIVTFAVDGVESKAVAARLAEWGVNVHLSEPGDTRLDFEARGLPTMIRASVHYFNTDAEAARFCDLVVEAVK